MPQQGTYQDYITQYLNKPNAATGRGFWMDAEAAKALNVTPEMVGQWRTMAQFNNVASLPGNQTGGQSANDLFQGLYGTQFDPVNQGAIPSVVNAANPTAATPSRPAASVPPINEAASAPRNTAPAQTTRAMPENAIGIGYSPGMTPGGYGGWNPYGGYPPEPTLEPPWITDPSIGWPGVWDPFERSASVTIGTRPTEAGATKPYNPGVTNPTGRPTTNQVPRGGTGGINPNARGVPGGAPTAGSWIKPAAGTAMGLYGATQGNGANFTYPGGDLSNQFQGLLTGTGKALTPYINNMGNYPFSQAGTALNNYYAAQAIPSYQSLMNGMGATQNAAGGMFNMGGNNASMISDWLNQIYTQGMPNQQAIQGLVDPQIAVGNELMGGAGSVNPYAGGNSPYGYQQLLQQVMAQGLPGQQNITNMGNQLASQVTGGGLTPEVVNAYKQLILQPQQEALQGAANRQGGGVAEVPTFDESGNLQTAGSGLFAELARRNERDFNNQLLTQGFQMTPALAGQATNAMTGVAGAASPYVNMAGNFANQGVQNALSAYGIIPSSISPYFNTGATMGTNQMAQGLQGLLSGNQNQNQAYNNIMSQILGLSGQQNQYALGQQGQSNDILRTILGGMFGQQNTQSIIDQQRQAQLMQAIAAGISGIPWDKIFP